MGFIELYIVNKSREKRWSTIPPCSRWYIDTDLPPASYWSMHRGEPIPRQDQWAIPGEVLELVVVFIDSVEAYYGVPRGPVRTLRILRRVRLNEDHTSYKELFHSPLYREWKQQGSLPELDPCFL